MRFLITRFYHQSSLQLVIEILTPFEKNIKIIYNSSRQTGQVESPGITWRKTVERKYNLFKEPPKKVKCRWEYNIMQRLESCKV